MITFRKFLTLRQSTQTRKIVKLLREAQEILTRGEVLDWDLWNPFFMEGWKAAGSGDFFPDHRDPVLWLRIIDRWRHGILDSLGISTADWDYSLSPRDGEARVEQRFPMTLFLEDLRSPFNVGSIFRSAEAFGVKNIILSPLTPGPEHLRVKRTAMGTDELLPWERGTLEDLDTRESVFALELGGQTLEDFEFPQKGICLLGTEELGLSPEALARADQSLGRVSIPLYGKKASLNVAVATGILLEAWTRSWNRPE